MTKKRFIKLTRAYFTRLNAWGKEDGCKPCDMGKLYKALPELAKVSSTHPKKLTRAEWWGVLAKGDVFGVGERR